MQPNALPPAIVGPSAWLGLEACASERWIHHLDDEEVEQVLALRRQQGGPDGVFLGHALDIIGDEALEEAARIVAPQADDAPVLQQGKGFLSV